MADGRNRFYEVLGDLYRPRDGGDVLGDVVKLACDALRSEHAGMMLVHADGTVASAAVSTELVERGDQLQLSLREGPCLSALDGGAVELWRERWTISGGRIGDQQPTPLVSAVC